MDISLVIAICAAVQSALVGYLAYTVGRRMEKEKSFKRGYDTAWVDRQLYDARNAQPRCPAGRFSRKPKLG